jgi:hypothetical protein
VSAVAEGGLRTADMPVGLVAAEMSARVSIGRQPAACVQTACQEGVSRGGVPPEHQPAVAAALADGSRNLRGLSGTVGG